MLTGFFLTWTIVNLLVSVWLGWWKVQIGPPGMKYPNEVLREFDMLGWKLFTACAIVSWVGEAGLLMSVVLYALGCP